MAGAVNTIGQSKRRWRPLLRPAQLQARENEQKREAQLARLQAVRMRSEPGER